LIAGVASGVYRATVVAVSRARANEYPANDEKPGLCIDWTGRCGLAVKTSFIEQGATFSEDRLYRYNLWRRWKSKASGKVTFVMLNPSTADAEKFDPTVRRCFG